MIDELALSWKGYKMFCSVSKDEKAGMPLVLIHGLGGSGADFKGVWESDLVKNRAIAVPDLIGFGKSDKPFDFSYDLMEQAQSISSIYEALGFQRADVVAHSMGGVVAILFAKLFPEKVNKLILAEPNLVPENAKISGSIAAFGSEEEFEKNYEKFIGRFNKKGSPSALRFYETLIQTPYYPLYRSAVSIIEHTGKPSYYDEFLMINSKKYFIRGEKSFHTMDEKILRDFHDKNIPLFEIPDAGHGMMGDNPEEFYSILKSILV